MKRWWAILPLALFVGLVIVGFQRLTGGDPAPGLEDEQGGHEAVSTHVSKYLRRIGHQVAYSFDDAVFMNFTTKQTNCALLRDPLTFRFSITQQRL